MAILGYRVLPPKCGCAVRGGAFASFQKVAEMLGESGAVMGSVDLPESGWNGEGDVLVQATESCHGMAEMRVEGGVDASSRGLSVGGNNRRKGRNDCEMSCVAERWKI